MVETTTKTVNKKRTFNRFAVGYDAELLRLAAETFGEKPLVLRDIEKMSGLSLNTVCLIMNGDADALSLHRLRDLCRALKVRVSQIAGNLGKVKMPEDVILYAQTSDKRLYSVTLLKGALDRKPFSYTILQLRDETGLSTSTLYSVLKYDPRVRVQTLAKICRALDVDMSDVLLD